MPIGEIEKHSNWFRWTSF